MEAYRLFAEILEYPHPELPARLGECIRWISPAHRQVAELLEDFRATLRTMDIARLEELYTAAFDMQQDCSPYVGHHLFGEDGRRNLFMARLSEEYSANGFERGSELPDHLTVLLRFLAQERVEAETARELITACMVPALSRMIEPLAARGHPYAPAIRALLLLLRDQSAVSTHGDEGVAG
jgi:nitrate reductase delta subunit